MKKTAKKSEENQNLNEEQLREQERLESVFPEQSAFHKILYTSANYTTAALTGAAILFALYFANLMIYYLRS